MKKVFALVLALALVFSMASVAMADITLEAKGASSALTVAGKYTASEHISLAIDWTDCDITLDWDENNKAWDVTADNVIFGVTNNGSNSKTVEFEATHVTNDFTTEATFDDTGTVIASVTGGRIDTAELIFTAVEEVARASVIADNEEKTVTSLARVIATVS